MAYLEVLIKHLITKWKSFENHSSSITVMGRMRKSETIVRGGMRNFAGGGWLFHGLMGIWGGVLLILFQSLKQQSVNIEHWLKSKLAWPVYAKSMKVKWK